MHIVVTGASSGIGRAIAEKFDTPGNKISLVARRLSLLDEFRSQLKCESVSIKADLADPNNHFSWIALAEEAFGPIDILVNNAGVSYVEPAQQIDQQRIDKLFEVNVRTPILAIQRVLPKMLERNFGCIINVASNAAFSPAPYFSHYSASKGALGNFSESLRMELKNTPVQILTVYPGPVETDMGDRNWQMLENYQWIKRFSPIGKSEVLADKVVRAVGTSKKRIIYPAFYMLNWHLPILGWLTSEYFFPKAKGSMTPPMPGDLGAQGDDTKRSDVKETQEVN